MASDFLGENVIFRGRLVINRGLGGLKEVHHATGPTPL